MYASMQFLPVSSSGASITVAGELEARETGDEHARDHGKGKGERRNACEKRCGFLGNFVVFSSCYFPRVLKPSFPFPSSLARPPLSHRERNLGTRQQFLPCGTWDPFLEAPGNYRAR